MTLSDSDAAIGQWLIHRYHHRTHPETEQTPLQRWLGAGWLRRMPETLEELNLLLLTVATPARCTATVPLPRPAVPGSDIDRLPR